MAAYALAVPAQWIITHWGWRPAFWCYAAAIAALIPWAWHAHPTRLASATDRHRAHRPGRADRLHAHDAAGRGGADLIRPAARVERPAAAADQIEGPQPIFVMSAAYLSRSGKT
jgi:hypothetical protein